MIDEVTLDAPGLKARLDSETPPLLGCFDSVGNGVSDDMEKRIEQAVVNDSVEEGIAS